MTSTTTIMIMRVKIRMQVNQAPQQPVQNNQMLQQQQPIAPVMQQQQVVQGMNALLPWQFRIENIWGEFDGDSTKWQAFHDSYKSRVYDDPTMPNVQKFQILRAALKGKAAKSLGEWQISDANFEPAWARLKQLYHDEYNTSKALLNKLFVLKKLDQPHGEKLQFLSNITQEVSRQLGALQFPSETL